MIVSFGSKATEEIYHGIQSKRTRKLPNEVIRTAERKLDLVNAAITVTDLRVPPGNRLKTLKGEKKGFYSIRINDQFRVVFEFKNGNAHQVEIIDYH